MTNDSSIAPLRELSRDHIAYAHQLQSQGKLAEAKIAYEAAIIENPQLANGYIGLSIVLSALGDNAAAISNLLKAAEIDAAALPADVYTNIGEVLLASGNAVEAQRCFEKGFRTYPDLASMHTALADFYEQIGDRSAAISLFHAAIARWPELGAVSNQEHVNLSLAYRIGVLEEKQDELCDRLISCLSQSDSYDLELEKYFSTGNCFARDGKLIQAEESYRQGLRQCPNCKELIFNLGLICYSRNLNQAALDLFSGLITLGYRTAEVYVLIGRIISWNTADANRHATVEALLTAALLVDPNSTEANLEMAGLLQSLGKTRESFTFFTQYYRASEKRAAESPLGAENIRFIDDDSTYALGHLAYLPDAFIKMQQLGIIPERKATMLIRPWMVSNRALLGYWRKYFNIIDDPKTIRQLRPLARNLKHQTAIAPIPSGQMVNVRMAMSYAQKEWEKQDRAPLLTLSTEDYERGWDCLESLGVPRGSWFVAMHIREAGFKNQAGCLHNTHRNADVLTFMKAAKEITSRGGWVIRLGEKLMKPIPTIERVVDYAHCDAKSDWMDLFLISQARFVMSTFSGVPLVAQTFGVPVILANCPPTLLSYGSKDIFAPKLMLNTKTNRLVTFKEWLSPPILECEMGALIAELGYKFIDNTEDELSELAVEMLSRLDGTISYSADDDSDQHLFRSYLPPDFGVISTRVGREFLKRHKQLL